MKIIVDHLFGCNLYHGEGCGDVESYSSDGCMTVGRMAIFGGLERSSSTTGSSGCTVAGDLDRATVFKLAEPIQQLNCEIF